MFSRRGNIPCSDFLNTWYKDSVKYYQKNAGSSPSGWLEETLTKFRIVKFLLFVSNLRKNLEKSAILVPNSSQNGLLGRLFGYWILDIALRTVNWSAPGYYSVVRQ